MKFNPLTGKLDIVNDPATDEQEYNVPAIQIDGVADGDGVITGTHIFTIPSTVDLTRPLKVFVDGAFTHGITTDETDGVKTMDLQVAPLLAAKVVLFYFPIT